MDLPAITQDKETKTLCARILLTVAELVVLCPAFALGEEPPKRPDWDQKKAVEMVKCLVAQEEKGDFAWDTIAWKTDPAEAAALAQKEQKPIFVYFFLKKNAGPATAPC